MMESEDRGTVEFLPETEKDTSVPFSIDGAHLPQR